MKIYTKTGDKGDTALFGGKRVPKSHLRLQAYGTVDELNAILGVVLSYEKNEQLQSRIELVQNELFQLGAELASPDISKLQLNLIEESSISRLESEMDEMEKELEPLKNFILPGGGSSGAYLQVARTICRRAERLVVELSESETIRSEAVIYLNRLSDALFVMSRYSNKNEGVNETLWKS